MRDRAAVLLAAVAVALLCAPAAAMAQGSPLGPLPPAPPPAPEDDQPVVADPSGGDLGGLEIALIAAAALGLIAAITYAIVRDAREAAPGDGRPAPVGLDGLDRETPKGSRPSPGRRASQSRKRARAAKRARRHNRPA